jgi:hypothetical protein
MSKRRWMMAVWSIDDMDMDMDDGKERDAKIGP